MRTSLIQFTEPNGRNEYSRASVQLRLALFLGDALSKATAVGQ